MVSRKLAEAIPTTVAPDLSEPVELTVDGEVVGYIVSKDDFEGGESGDIWLAWSAINRFGLSIVQTNPQAFVDVDWAFAAAQYTPWGGEGNPTAEDLAEFEWGDLPSGPPAPGWYVFRLRGTTSLGDVYFHYMVEIDGVGDLMHQLQYGRPIPDVEASLDWFNDRSVWTLVEPVDD